MAFEPHVARYTERYTTMAPHRSPRQRRTPETLWPGLKHARCRGAAVGVAHPGHGRHRDLRSAAGDVPVADVARVVAVSSTVLAVARVVRDVPATPKT